MKRNEIDDFEQLSYYQDAVRLRRWEDAYGKLGDTAVPSFDRYRPLLERLAIT